MPDAGGLIVERAAQPRVQVLFPGYPGEFAKAGDVVELLEAVELFCQAFDFGYSTEPVWTSNSQSSDWCSAISFQGQSVPLRVHERWATQHPRRGLVDGWPIVAP